MNRPFAAAALAFAFLLTGCAQVFDAMVNSTNPHSLSASRGEGYSVSVSWSAPNYPEGDPTKVVRYRVYKDGGQVATTTSTSWSDSPPYGTKHTYKVQAETDKNGMAGLSGDSNSDTGWCVPGKPLVWGTRMGAYASPTDTGWYKTYLARGWTYHVVNLSGSGITIEVYDGDDPQNGRLAWGTDTLVWTSDRSKKVWVKVSAPTTLTAWYD